MSKKEPEHVKALIEAAKDRQTAADVVKQLKRMGVHQPGAIELRGTDEGGTRGSDRKPHR